QGVEEVVVAPRHGEHDHRDLSHVSGDLGRGGDAAARHVDVEEGDVRPKRSHGIDRRRRVDSLADGTEPAVLEAASEGSAGRRVVVSDDDAEARSLYVHLTVTVVPSPGAEAIENVAPIALARSRMLIRPNPPLVMAGSNPV